MLATSVCLSLVLSADPTALAQSPDPSFDAVSINPQKGATFNTTNTPMAGVLMARPGRKKGRDAVRSY